MNRHFITIQDFEPPELEALLQLIEMLKEADKKGATPKLLPDMSLGMIFEEPSTRTRVSFEVAMTELGGHALYLRPGEIHLGERETVADTARVLSRMVDGIEARLLEHEDLLELARWSTVPVINGLTDLTHPTQALCDVFTMMECKPDREAINVTFVGDATNVLNSLMLICTRLGLNFTHAAPRKYQPTEEFRQQAAANARQSGSRLVITADVEQAVKEADFIYTDLWWWVGQEDEVPERYQAFMPRYQVNAGLIAKAPPHVKFMHCLPASRGVEATDEVLDGPHSIIFDQAENRLHTEKALLVAFLGPQLRVADPETKKREQRRIESFLEETWPPG